MDIKFNKEELRTITSNLKITNPNPKDYPLILDQFQRFINAADHTLIMLSGTARMNMSKTIERIQEYNFNHQFDLEFLSIIGE